MINSAKTGPKDVFGQILAIAGLYVSVIAFGTLIFVLVDIYFPDVLNYYDVYSPFAGERLRWPLAILVVVFPLFLWWNSLIQREAYRNPEKKELRSRKWFLYFTVFAAAVIIIGDLVALVYRYLNGDLTIQFVLKILAVFGLAVSVFSYYLWIIRKDIPATQSPKMKWFVRLIVAAGAFFVVFGFITAGSPGAQRARRFDERRVTDLQAIQSEIIYQWQAKEVLPQSLEQLRDSIRGFAPPTDPETGAAYEYRVLGRLEFELCANFITSSKAEESRGFGPAKPLAMSRPPYPAFEESWPHGAGRTCFQRTIDPELFPRTFSK